MKRQEPSLNGPSCLLVSGVIVATLALQAAAAFGWHQPLLSYRPSYLWPFTDYPMYHVVHREGEAVGRLTLWGVLADSKTVDLTPELLGLNYWEFTGGPVACVIESDHEGFETYRAIAERRLKARLVGLRLESRPLRITRQGPVAEPLQVLAEMPLPAQEKAE